MSLTIPGITTSAAATVATSFPSRAKTSRVSSQALDIDIFATGRLLTLVAALCEAGGGHAIALAQCGDGRHLPPMEAVAGVEWQVSEGLTSYEDALARMESRSAAIRAGQAGEQVWLLEHPPLFTAGTSAAAGELINPMRFPVHEAGRGGRYTYHGPGQRVGYLMLDLDRRGRDIRRFVHSLEAWLTAALADLGVEARREPGRIGLWVGAGAEQAKIAAIGVRVKRWVTLHGFSINVDPDLSHFAGIVPCGIAEYGVTSLAQLGKNYPISALDSALAAHFQAFLTNLEAHDKVP